jgi:putative ABC transport system permease protein
MINVVDSTKTAGLVFIPGTTVGMLLGGAEPLDAIKLQLILFYLLVGGVTIAVVLAGTLAYRGFFTAAHQLRELPA